MCLRLANLPPLPTTGEWSDCTNLGSPAFTNLNDPTVRAGLAVLYANQMSVYSARGGDAPGAVGQHHWALRMGSGWDPRPVAGAETGRQLPGTAWNQSFANYSNAVWNLGELIRVGVGEAASNCMRHSTTATPFSDLRPP